jgi:hypothetical protein
MATKKSAKKSGKKSVSKSQKKSLGNPSALIFRIDWIKDPGPDALGRFLNPEALRRLNALKRDFGAKAKEIINTGRR